MESPLLHIGPRPVGPPNSCMLCFQHSCTQQVRTALLPAAFFCPVLPVMSPGKLSVLHRLLTKLHARGHRVVLFSQFTMMLGILEDYLSQAGFE